MKMTKLFSLALLVSTIFIGQPLSAQEKRMAQEHQMIGGAAMYPTKNIVENALNSKDHSTLVTAIKTADMVDLLSSDGPFTVFAPTNAAFDELPEGTIKSLVQRDKKENLQTILKYHVVAGRWNAQDILKLVKENKGKAYLRTVSGGNLVVWNKGSEVYITDENANSAKVMISDVKQSNGIIHVIDGVLLPGIAK